MARVFTFLSDFGTEDSYVAEMKAVLLAKVPGAVIVDITHQIPPYHIERAAFQLLRAHQHFPRGTWHIAIVDPGVGTERRAIYVRTRDYHFVGPDNGVLRWAVQACEKRENQTAGLFEIPSPADLTPTFHGRDLFTPFAAEQSRRPKHRLRVLENMHGRDFPVAKVHGVGRRGEILLSDHFGNLVTSIAFDQEIQVEGTVEGIKDRLVSASHYSALPEGRAGLIRGSHGFWEIACGQGSAAKLLKVGPGTHVTLFPARGESI